MTRIFLPLLLFILLPTNVWSLDKYFIVESGYTHSSVNPDSFFVWETDNQMSQNSDASFGIMYGQDVSEKLSLEIGYSDFGDSVIFPLENNTLTQKTDSINFQARYHLGTIRNFLFSAHLGVSRWSSKINLQQPQSNLLIASLSSLVLTNSLDGHSSLKSNGFSTQAGLGVSYLINESMSLGVEFQHYEKAGNKAVLIDFDKLAIGDLAGALQVIPADVSLDVVSVNLLFRF